MKKYIVDPTLPFDEQLFVLQDRDGDYVESVKSTGMETSKWHFTFTKDKKKVRIWTPLELWDRLATNPPGVVFTTGYAGGKAVRIR